MGRGSGGHGLEDSGGCASAHRSSVGPVSCHARWASTRDFGKDEAMDGHVGSVRLRDSLCGSDDGLLGVSRVARSCRSDAGRGLALLGQGVLVLRVILLASIFGDWSRCTCGGLPGQRGFVSCGFLALLSYGSPGLNGLGLSW